jgi:hypothetical protein
MIEFLCRGRLNLIEFGGVSGIECHEYIHPRKKTIDSGVEN